MGWLGRVKTLHPGVHGGILARRDLPAHMDALQHQGISPIDLASSLSSASCSHLLFFKSIPSATRTAVMMFRLSI